MTFPLASEHRCVKRSERPPTTGTLVRRSPGHTFLPSLYLLKYLLMLTSVSRYLPRYSGIYTLQSSISATGPSLWLRLETPKVGTPQLGLATAPVHHGCPHTLKVSRTGLCLVQSQFEVGVLIWMACNRWQGVPHKRDVPSCLSWLNNPTAYQEGLSSAIWSP